MEEIKKQIILCKQDKSKIVSLLKTIKADDLKIMTDTGYKKYVNKAGMTKTGFFCLFCDFASDRTANTKVHMKSCPMMIKTPPQGKKMPIIPLLEIDLEPEFMGKEIDNLVCAMRDLTDLTMLGDENKKYAGALAMRFRNNFLPQTMFKNTDWNKMKLEAEAEEKGYFYDSRFKFLVRLEEGLTDRIKILEIIPYLVQHFRDIFILAYEKLSKFDFYPTIFYWHKIIYGEKHKNDKEIHDYDSLEVYSQPIIGSQEWHKDRIEIINKSKPVYVS